MQELVEMFVGELPDRIDAIEKAIEEQNRASLGQLAHQLRGAAGGYGFPTISDAAELLESSAKAGKELETLRLQTLQLRELYSRSSATGVLLKS
jgi:HPt (histidine-containing phosphotransfer) domain-containing protein